METVSQVLARQPQISQPTSTGEQKEMINKIFATIKVLYPTSAWKNQDESQTKRMWLAHIGKESALKVDQALLVLIDHFPTFAPTLGEFKSVLKKVNEKKSEFFKREALPAPKNPNIGFAELEKMRAILK